jgi:OOP family OmpA-OmpF porin
MKKSLQLFSILFLSFFAANSQVIDTTSSLTDSFNKWSIELSVGQSKGIKPYADGYYASNPNKFLGRLQANSFGIAGRYMLSPKFGFKVDFAYDKLNNDKDTESLPFEMQQFRLGIQGVVNATRLFGIEEASGRFGLLFHGGLQFSRMTSKTENVIENDQNNGVNEYNGGIVLGLSPQFRVTKTIAIIADFSVLNNYRQHFNWDGSYSDNANNLSGQMISTSLGLSFSFGNEKVHGDWAIIQDKNKEELENLDKRIGDMETMMNDTDKDGVPDYLDTENNSIAGVAVDTKGRMVDMNTNGVPDELEKYMAKAISTSITQSEKTTNAEMLAKLINDGYIAVYFDTNKSKPTNASTENIGFILTYLRNNPTASIDISGYADETGKNEKNNKLSSDRAENIKNTLVKAGIGASRINIVAAGEDTSVDPASGQARSLVRRATFKIK